ncbi:MAG: hypothetical protein IJR29_06440 [Butyrivibrio sp.]|nr:hypothetical protein [Butyrivibrio sp.]
MIRKTRWQGKVGARAIASAMSVAMGLSSFSAAMPGGIAYAENEDGITADQSGTDSSAEESSVLSSGEASSVEDSSAAGGSSAEGQGEESSSSASSSEASSEAASEASSDASSGASSEEASEEASKEISSEKDEKTVTQSEDNTDNSTDRSFDSSKKDVWDFGAENLGDDYNNRLDAATINGFYSVEAGSTGANIASFSVDDGDFIFEDGGYSATHRLRTTNTALTRYDAKSLKDSDGNVYSGYLYSNKAATSDVYVAVQCQADDIITAYVASNGTDSNVTFENTNDSTDSVFYTHSLGSSTVSKFVYYPSENAQYKLYSASEKLVLARVVREHAQYAYLTGTVEGFDGTGSVVLVFTNRQNGNVVKATVGDGTFTAQLAEGFDYDITLEGADSYVITSDKSVNISGDTQMNVELSGVELVSYTGKVTGIATDDVKKFVDAADFTFAPQDEESVYVPNITLTADNDEITYEVSLQSGVTYDVTVADKEDTNAVKYAAVDDYDLLTTQIEVKGSEKDFEIALEAKPVYKVTISPKGAQTEDLKEALFTFTRLDVDKNFEADGYVYEFTGTNDIALRDGQYAVEVTNTGALVQQLTSNLIVNGADVTKEISFSSDITEWDFSDSAFAAKFSNATSGTYNGLSWTNGKSHNGTYLYSGAGTISVPVKGSCQIQVTANYQYSYYFENDSEASVNVKTGSTSQNDTFTYNYSGDAGTFDITVLGTSYITKIATVYQTEYKSKLTVGASDSADYNTIGDALEAVRLMDRAEGERVTISIEPGDYEEMLVVDVPDVTLENASANPTNTLTNSGVDIDENAVRITWYYGHGYTYYSMGSDCKYDEELLAVNKANGYPSFENPGSGTTAGSYWNATVVVSASGFEAKNIIFENSFNQYVSKKAAEDVIVPQSGAKEGSVARADMQAGDTTVQDKAYVERAAALALTASATENYFENCRIIGRQDTLYGAASATAAFYNCAVYGGTDYIFGGMTAVFAKCDLVLNTSENSNDVAYITAAQQQSQSSRGYLMYNCTVKSTTPGVDTASKYTSKPGQFGRPWQANTSEVVFFDTVVETTNWTLSGGKYVYDADSTVSLIQPAGWNTTLGGQSARNVEYGTYEVSGEDNSAARVSWVQQPETAVCADGTAISVAAFLGEWDPFAENNDDMTIVFPDGTSEDAPVADDEPVAANTEFTVESSELTAFSAGAKADGESEKAGTDNYFTLLYSVKSKIDSSSKTWDDGYTSSQRINFGGAASTEKNAIKFTTSASDATVKVWWACGDAGRQMAILDANGDKVLVSSEAATKNSPYISTFKLADAGTYYLGGATGNNYIFKVEVTDGAKEEVERAKWDTVAAPVIKSVALDEEDPSNVIVTVSAVVGNNGGDKVSCEMTDENGQIIETLYSSAEKDEFEFTFTPSASGEYTFVAALFREGDEANTKTCEKAGKISFVLPLAAPLFKNAVNKGAGTVQVKFYSTPEATEYTLIAKDKTDESAALVKATYTPDEVVSNSSTEYVYSFVGLTVGHDYELSLYASRGEDVSDASTLEISVTSEGEREWTFSAFGQGVALGEKNVGYTVNEDDSVTVWDLNNKGKIVPASTDGLSFYYTAIPADQNFTLTATATIDYWTFTNGQEGFGLMAADRVGVNGNSSVFWNNSYMASGTKVEYYYDTEKGEATTDATGVKVTMKNGLGAQQKIGVTKDNLSRLEANDTTAVNEEFSSSMYTLETSCAANGSGTYNLWGNEKGGTASTIANPLVQVRLRIQKNNTGYFVSYLDENDNVISMKKFYDTKALEQIDSENVYVGFFTSRSFKATFSNIELVTIDPADDEPAEEQPVTYVAPSYNIISASYSNTASYELQYSGNADGVLTITDAAGKKLVDALEVTAGTVTSVKTKLSKGDNAFEVSFTPNADFHPDNNEYQLLSSYETATFTHTVKYSVVNDDEKIYVSPDGKADATGSESEPVDIYTAVKYVQPGQTIVLKAGTYSLTSTVTVARGIDGTPDKPIKMVTDGGRAIFDFNRKCAGFVFAGNYWYVNGFDCTHSGNSLKGIQVSGSHITLEDIHTYENGNTGIQVSRYLTTDEYAQWPSYDLILNCTSYSNADSGYEDADGFAAKLTVGDGVVFDGCISYNNADDGWDLFAKVESGCIGQVTIQNSVAFANGYGVDGTNEGNGNGFKMGGSSMSGPHKLINSVAWGNKAKGIDSNSGPDIQVYNSMSFNNGSNNVALYTNDTANTAYYVDGVLSYRTTGTGTNENIKAKGTQDTNNIYGKLNFFWTDGKSSNSDGLTVTDDWFVSLDAPYASASDPLAVAASIRAADGSINLGDFLKLSETGIAALSAAGINYSDVVASLNGEYDAVTDERNISGSSEDAAKDVEEEEEEIQGEFVTKWGVTYFVTTDGENLTGLNVIEGAKYFFKSSGAMVKSDYVTVDNVTYYFGSDGKAVTGIMTKWGASYGFAEDGAQYKNAIGTIDGVKYYFKSNGAMLKSDFVTIEGNTYYFGSNGAMVTGFMTKWGTTYYFDENGVEAKDTLVTVDGYTYYFKANGAMVKSAFVTLDDGKHYFDGNGHMLINTTMTKWGVKYTFDENGVLV